MPPECPDDEERESPPWLSAFARRPAGHRRRPDVAGAHPPHPGTGRVPRCRHLLRAQRVLDHSLLLGAWERFGRIHLLGFYLRRVRPTRPSVAALVLVFTARCCSGHRPGANSWSPWSWSIFRWPPHVQLDGRVRPSTAVAGRPPLVAVTGGAVLPGVAAGPHPAARRPQPAHDLITPQRPAVASSGRTGARSARRHASTGLLWPARSMRTASSSAACLGNSTSGGSPTDGWSGCARSRVVPYAARL